MKFPLLLIIGLLVTLTGCAGYWGGGYYDDGVVVSEPDVYLFGGGYDSGRDVNNYSHRGSVSRQAAHPGGSSRVAHVGGSSRAAHVGGVSGAAHPSGVQGGRR